ncbi:MAG TPA: hypothetical protein VNN19_09290 [bacterium]|nr:hypothetical protein [bacterium]
MRRGVAAFLLLASVLAVVWVTAPPETLRFLLRSPIVLAREIISFIRAIIAPPPTAAGSGSIAFIGLQLGSQGGSRPAGAGLGSDPAALPASPARMLFTTGSPSSDLLFQGSGDGGASAGLADGDASGDQEGTSVADDLLAPAEELLAPADDLLAPAEGLLAPAEELLEPAEELLEPAEQLVEPVEQAVEPVEQAVEPVVEPAQELLEPVQEVVNPSSPGEGSSPGETSPGDGSSGGELPDLLDPILPDLGAP